MIQRVLDTPFINLDVNIDVRRLLNEYQLIEREYGFENYQTKYWPVRRKYARSWSGICLFSSDGGLYSDMYEGDQATVRATELLLMCPYMYDVVKKIGGPNFNERARILRISPRESLVWHNHTFEHGQSATTLTIQVPIIVPPNFQYCVVKNTDFKWHKRFSKPNKFKHIATMTPDPGQAFVFNSFHYHNVFNNSDQYRATLMFYVDYNDPHVQSLINRSGCWKTRSIT